MKHVDTRSHGKQGRQRCREAFAPRENPEIAVVVFFEHGRHGPTASEIARDVLKAYFDKKARQQNVRMAAVRPFTPDSLLASAPRLNAGVDR